MDGYHNTNLNFRGKVEHTDGLATDHGTFSTGHVTIYTAGGSLTVSAESPETLRSIARALETAATKLDVALATKRVEVPA